MPKKNIIKYTLICALLSIILTFSFIVYKSSIKTNINLENKMVTHFIDVGQGDCILIQVNNKNLLIDSGPSDSKAKMIRYLKNNNITKLDYVIATHPDEDHIGGMASVIKTFKVDKFYAPKVTSSTVAFEEMIRALRLKNLKINIAYANITLDLGPDTICVMLSPNKSEYKDTNGYSCAIKVSYKNSTYLFTGDLEALNEAELLNKGYDLSADVLKVAHHGSKSSTTEGFLNAVYPQIAILSCGLYNTYGHPHKQTLDKLQKINSTVYRTDKDKTIILVSDGTTIKKLDLQ
jgi:competence protein ComEC